MKYVAPRDMTVTSLSGRSVEFIKGEATHCPPQMHAELIGKGIVPAEEIPEEAGKPVAVELTAEERQAAFFKAFEVMAVRNTRGEFTGTGAPHVGPLTKELGWTSAVDAKERDAMWQLFQAGKA